MTDSYVTPKEIAKRLKDEFGVETDNEGKKVRSFMRKEFAKRDLETPGKGGGWRIPAEKADKMIALFLANRGGSGAIVEFDIFDDDAEVPDSVMANLDNLAENAE